jgi:hypothetical protein
MDVIISLATILAQVILISLFPLQLLGIMLGIFTSCGAGITSGGAGITSGGAGFTSGGAGITSGGATSVVLELLLVVLLLVVLW